MYVGDDFDDKIFEMIEKDDLSGMHEYADYMVLRLDTLNTINGFPFNEAIYNDLLQVILDDSKKISDNMVKLLFRYCTLKALHEIYHCCTYGYTWSLYLKDLIDEIEYINPKNDFDGVLNLLIDFSDEKEYVPTEYKKYRKDYSKYLFAKLKRINLKRKNCSN